MVNIRSHVSNVEPHEEKVKRPATLTQKGHRASPAGLPTTEVLFTVEPRAESPHANRLDGGYGGGGPAGGLGGGLGGGGSGLSPGGKGGGG